MKLLSLNLWGGKQDRQLFDYLKKQSESADIFCFQEVFTSPKADNLGTLEDGTRPQLFKELSELLKSFNGYFVLTSKNHGLTKAKLGVDHGLAIFARKNLAVVRREKKMIAGTKDYVFTEDFIDFPCAVFHLKLSEAGLNIFNYHGIPVPGEKLDTQDRVEASQKIAQFLSETHGAKILCGDFNLMPETKSIKILQDTGLKNLISQFGITNTRNEMSWNIYANKQSFADYTFVSPQIKVKNFEVPYNLVSDHLPMILEFEI